VSSEKTLDRLLSRQCLADLVAAYSRAADRADAGALGLLFHEGSLADSGVIRAEGREFAKRFVEWVHEHAEAISHAVCSSWFEIDGDRAVGESYVLAMCRYKAAHGGRQSLTSGRYLDRFSRIDGTWKFSERRFVVDAVAMLDAGPALNAPGVLTGRFAPHDPVCGLWRTAVR
jgi:hypothetical protein